MEIKIRESLKGRAITLVDEKIYFGRNYELWFCNLNQNKSLVLQIPRPFKRKVIEPFRLLCRLFRHEIRGYLEFSDKSKVVATRQGLYYVEARESIIKLARFSQSFLAVKPPMAITLDSEERILWGEYWGNSENREVRIFISSDKGKNYEPVYEFKRGEVRHIHNILEDPYEKCYWICAGDHHKEPGIGRLSKDFKNFSWLAKGEQCYRMVNGFIFKDKIIYGTDTEKDFNHIYAIDKNTGKLDELCQTPGSCIYAAKFGKWYVVSTSVEYFEKYKNTMATLWISKDALNWYKAYEVKKDMWSKTYFQFGSIILPRSGWNRDEIVFSGQALKDIDNKLCIAEVIE